MGVSLFGYYLTLKLTLSRLENVQFPIFLKLNALLYMYKFAHVQICTYICRMIEYIENNAEWLFSGIGITLFSLFITIIIAIIFFRIWLRRINFQIKIQAEITNGEIKKKK